MNSLDVDHALLTAVLAVRGSARLLRRHRHDPPPSQLKTDGSAVTELDLLSERRMRHILRSRYPDHTVVGEEGPFEPGSAGYLWYLDPLDGTRVYAAGQDTCAVAATLTRDGVPLLAAVAAPFSGELYTACRGRVSRVNGRSIRAAAQRPAADGEMLLYYDSGEPGLSTLDSAAVAGELGRLTVMPGSFILNACRAAKGAYDAYLCIKRHGGSLMPWDLAPAALVLDGAQGVLQDLEGRPLGGMIPAREVAGGAPDAVARVVAEYGPRLRSPHPPLAWARRNEAVFARLRSLLLGRPGCRVIAIGGAGGGIGKTSLARELAALLGDDHSTVVSLDDYLLARKVRDARGVGAHDPAANDLARAAADLARLRSGAGCVKPVYDHARGGAHSEETVTPVRFLIAEGVMALHPTLRPQIDLGIFLDASPAVRYRRVRRDIEEKALTEAYARSVHERLEDECRRYLLPLRDAADVIVSIDESFRLTWVAPAQEP